MDRAAAVMAVTGWGKANFGLGAWYRCALVGLEACCRGRAGDDARTDTADIYSIYG